MADVIAERMRTILLGIVALAPLEEVAERLAEAARALTEADFAAIGVYDATGGLEHFVTVGVDAHQRARIGHPPIGRGLFGELQRRAELMNVESIGQHEASSGFPEHHPAMGPFLGVPVVYAGAPIGAFYVTRRPGGAPFSRAAEGLLLELAPYAAVAMSNAITLEREQRRTAVADALSELSAHLHQAGDEAEISLRLLETLQRLFPDREVGVGFASPDGDEPVLLPPGSAVAEALGTLVGSGSRGRHDLAVGSERRAVAWASGADTRVCAAVSALAGEDLSDAELHAIRQVANIGAIGLSASRRRDAEAVLERYGIRDSIARDLHDDLIQSIYAIGLGLHSSSSDPEVLRGVVQRATAELNEVIRDLRAYITQLSRGAEGVTAAELLRTRIEALLRGQQTPRWEHHLALDGVELTPRQERQLYLIVREAISNVHRHAGASRASLTLEATDGEIRLEVRDDGRGFTRNEVSPNAVGLRSLEERVADLGGSIRIDSKPGQGTQIDATFPSREGGTR